MYIYTLVFYVINNVTVYFKLKAEFLAVQHLRGMSGWSWDEARHKVTAPDDVWDIHIAVHLAIFSRAI